jgi:ATPase subunit of ABC transporter with duplicated ATPase domains
VTAASSRSVRQARRNPRRHRARLGRIPDPLLAGIGAPHRLQAKLRRQTLELTSATAASPSPLAAAAVLDRRSLLRAVVGELRNVSKRFPTSRQPVLDALSHPRGSALGGRTQRVAIARALAARPAILLADEPTARLDHANARAVGELLSRLAHISGAAVIYATHDRTLIELSDATLTLVAPAAEPSVQPASTLP